MGFNSPFKGLNYKMNVAATHVISILVIAPSLFTIMFG
jgi:hypothetical protein